MISCLVSTECLLVWAELEPLRLQSQLSWLQMHINNNHYQGGGENMDSHCML